METVQLEKELEKADKFDKELIKSNAAPDLYTFLTECLEQRGMSRSDLIKKLNVERGYGYQLLNGTRTLSRTHLIKIGLILRLDIEQFQRMMRIAGAGQLYVKDLFDAKIFYAVKHEMDYDDAVLFIWDGKEV